MVDMKNYIDDYNQITLNLFQDRKIRDGHIIKTTQIKVSGMVSGVDV